MPAVLRVIQTVLGVLIVDDVKGDPTRGTLCPHVCFVLFCVAFVFAFALCKGGGRGRGGGGGGKGGGGKEGYDLTVRVSVIASSSQTSVRRLND